MKTRKERVAEFMANICIDDHDFVSIEADCGSDVGAWANVTFAAMEKMVQIKNHWNEIKRLVE